MTHIKQSIDVMKNSHHYAYRRDCFTADAISAVIHQALTHLGNKDPDVRLMFLDFAHKHW